MKLGWIFSIGYIAFIVMGGLSMFFKEQDWRNDPRYKSWLKGDRRLTYRQLTALHDKGLKDLTKT